MLVKCKKMICVVYGKVTLSDEMCHKFCTEIFLLKLNNALKLERQVEIDSKVIFGNYDTC